MTNRFDINRSQRGIPAFSVLLIMAALAVIGVAMLPMLNVQYTPSPVERKIDVSFTWPDASDRKSTRLNSSHVALSRMPSCS